jgi:Sulfotransferase domain
MIDSQMLRRARFRSKIVRGPTVWARHLGVQRNDVILASYPRSGTTWMRFLVSEALSGQSSEFKAIRRIIPYVGQHRNAVPVLPGGGKMMYSHDLLSKDATERAIYVVRDVRDVALSEYKWQQRIGVFDGELDPFIRDFVSGRGNPFGSWGHHIDSWVRPERIDADNLKVVKFEDLKRDAGSALSSVLGFLGVTLSGSEIDKAVASNSVHMMRQKEDRAPKGSFKKRVVKRNVRFVNAGSVGQWQKALNPAQERLLEDAFGAQLQRLGYELHS